MASGDLSVALVIDTAADLTAQELAAVQSGATEFLLRLPRGAHTMVVAAGGEPQVVAPLRAHTAEALSAISTLRTGGSPATMAGTMLAAQSLESAPAGPRVIIVYTHSIDEQGVLIQQLSQALLQAEAVVNVIPTGAESIWPSVVDRTGGVVLPPTGAAGIAQAYGRLATMLTEQYIVTFQAPEELPAVAQVAFRTGDREYRAAVNLPEAGTSANPAGQPTEPGSAGQRWGLIFSVASGLLAVLVALALVLRARRNALLGSVPAADAVQAPVDADRSEKAPQTASPPGPATGSAPRRSPGSSLSAAIQGRRLARHHLDHQSEDARRHPPHDEEPPSTAEDVPARPPIPEDAPRPTATTAGAKPPPPQSDAAPQTVVPAVEARIQHTREDQNGRNATTVLTGSGDAFVELTSIHSGATAVHITGNSASQYFAVQTQPTTKILVMTSSLPYDGVRLLDWDGEQSTSFKIWATGPWRIETLPLSAIPTFTRSFNGSGDMVVHFTGTGSLVEITGNVRGRHFEVRALGAHGARRRLVATTGPYAGSCQISRGPQLFEIQATGSWTITLKKPQAA